MSWHRVSLLTAAWSGFVLCMSLTGGCSLFGGEDNTGGSSQSTAGSGGDTGTGGAGGNASGGTTSSSSSSGAPVECTDHTSLNESACSLVKQDCSNPGEACIPSGTATTCAFQTGIKGVGGSCSENKECAAGLLCVFFTCAPICCPSKPEAFCGSAKCNVNINFGQNDVWACNLSKACTLFGTDCPENQQCRLGDPTQELSLCAPTSGALSPEGGPCQFLNDCGANQICSNNVCRYTCSLADWQSKAPGQGGCPNPQTCKGVSANYGTCNP